MTAAELLAELASPPSGLRPPARVHVTYHALDQLRSRQRVFARVPDRVLAEMIRIEIREAIAEGRLSCTRPASSRMS